MMGYLPNTRDKTMTASIIILYRTVRYGTVRYGTYGTVPVPHRTGYRTVPYRTLPYRTGTDTFGSRKVNGSSDGHIR